MDRRQLELLRAKINEAVLKSSDLKIVNPKNRRNYSKTGEGGLPDILKQRQKQRKWLFRYALTFSGLCFLGLTIMLTAQGLYKYHHQAELFGKLELGTVAVGVFVQFLGLLKIITQSIWSDKEYLKAGALKEKDKIKQ